MWFLATGYTRHGVYRSLITGPPTHSVGALARLHIWCRGARLVTLAGVCRRRLWGSVTLHGGPAGGFTRAGQAMTSCRLQSNYSSTVTLYGGPVVLHPVRATPCCDNVSPEAQIAIN